MSVDEEDEGGPRVRAKGTWTVVDRAIHWRYTETHGIPLPKKVDVNPIVHIDEHTFSVREANRAQSDWYRFVMGEDTSANLDAEQVEPLCKRIATFIDAGFGETEIDALVKKLQRLKPDGTYQVVYSITYKGTLCPVRVRVFMDDVDSPDIHFFAPLGLARRIDREFQQL